MARETPTSRTVRAVRTRTRGEPRSGLLVLSAAALLLAGCSSLPDIPVPKIPGVYRLDVQQGNLITQEMLDRLEIGMEKRKVRFVLGTPLLIDPFNHDRWEYLYSFKSGGGDRVQRRISILFENERLILITGDLDSVARESTTEAEEKLVTVPQIREDRGLFSALTPNFFEESRAPDRPTPPAAPESDAAESAESVPESTGTENAGSEDAPSDESAFTRFLKTLTKSGDEPLEATATPEVATAAASPSVGQEDEDSAREDDDFLRDLFRPLGSTGAVRSDEAAPAPASAAVEAPTTAGEPDSDQAAPADEDAGFLRGLMDKLREKVGSDDASEPAPAAPATATPAPETR